MTRFFTYCGLSTAMSLSTVFLAPREANAQSFRVMRNACPQPCFQQPYVCSTIVHVASLPQTYCVDNASQPMVTASMSTQTSTQSSPFGFRSETRSRTVTKYLTEQRTKTTKDSNGNEVTQTYTVQVPVTEQVEETVQVARTQADVIRETDAAVAQLSRNIDDIQKKLLKIQKEDDPNKILPTLQTLEELIKEMKANAGK